MKRVVFCGVGALGSTAAVFCRNLDMTPRFVDFDRVESKNVLSQAFVKQSIGKNEAEALELQLANFHGLKAESMSVRLADSNAATLLGDADLLVDCFDNAKSRRILSAFSRAHAKPLVHAALSADGTFGLVRWEDRFTADEEDAVPRDGASNGASPGDAAIDAHVHGTDVTAGTAVAAGASGGCGCETAARESGGDGATALGLLVLVGTRRRYRGLTGMRDPIEPPSGS